MCRAKSWLKDRDPTVTSLLSLIGILILDCILLIVAIMAPWVCRKLLGLSLDCWTVKFGLLCPSCGGTRAVLLLLRGRVVEAFYMNAYFIITGAVIFVGILVLHLSIFWERSIFCRISRMIFHPYSVVLWACGWGVFGVLRNLI